MKNDFSRLGNLKVKQKESFILIVLIVIILIFVIKVGYFDYGIGMTEGIKNNRINQALANKEYNKAREMTNKYLSGTDKETVALKKLHLSTINVCEQTNTGSLEESISKYNELKASTEGIKITKTEITQLKYSSNYKNIEITIKNDGDKNINHIKIGLDFKDKNGNIIQSDWTDNNFVIKSNDTQILTKMISNDVKFDTVQAKILEFR